MHVAMLLPGVALLLLSGSVHGQLDQGIAAATAAQAGQLNEAVQNLSNSVSGQLRDVVQALAKSGQLPIAAQTIAGFVSHTLCEGEYLIVMMTPPLCVASRYCSRHSYPGPGAMHAQAWQSFASYKHMDSCM